MSLDIPERLIERRVFTDVALEDNDNTASWLVGILNFGDVVYLHGDLGAGKTTLVSAIAKALNSTSNVSSPTFSLLHEYPVMDEKTIIHMDLYRIHHADELEFIGIREYLDNMHLIFIEWWQNGVGFIPEPNMLIDIRKNERDNNLRTVRILCDK